jgi:YVTN family beta-propeller protein
MLQSPDARQLVVSNDGYGKPTLSVIDIGTWTLKDTVSLEHAWLGLAWHPDGRRLYSSGAAQNFVQELSYVDGAIKPARTFQLPPVQGESYVGGLAVSPRGDRLFAVRVFAQTVSVVDLENGEVLNTISLPAEPYTCVLSADGRKLYVSLWGGGKVLELSTATLAVVAEFQVGEHPNAMSISPDGQRLFVACANTNAVWVLDLQSRKATEQISIALYPNAPAGSTPNGLGLSPDGRTLLVANADNNTVAFVDVSGPFQAKVAGFIPAGWYPTGASFSRDGKQIFILSGKGLASAPNPQGPTPGNRRPDAQYAGSMFKGAVSVLPTPDRAAIEAFTRTVYRLTPYSDMVRDRPADAPAGSPIPSEVGKPSVIKHVFYVIRENRTYDQVLGDIAQGNGDSSLCLFGEAVTPNVHALVQQFVLFDNFYVDAEVSYSGHAYSTAAYSNDMIEKIWPAQYASRGGPAYTDGGGPRRTDYGSIAAPPQGYLWDFCKRAGVSVRSYGEFVRPQKGQDGRVLKNVATVPGLEGLINPDYPPFDLTIPDARRVDVWLKEFVEFERSGGLPQLSIIRLGNDHTNYTAPGFPTPRAFVAENDLALGRLVEAITKSRFWKESAIFVLEDDAQSGPDHVDAHRSVALIMSPFARRGFVDSTMYTTSGMLRTMELILGLPPMSQYDAAATPAYNAFQATAVLAPFTHFEARVRLDERNPTSAYGAAASLRMNLEEADLVPDLEGNEILWRSIKGAGVPMPPPRRTVFVRSIEKDDKEP